MNVGDEWVGRLAERRLVVLRMEARVMSSLRQAAWAHILYMGKVGCRDSKPTTAVSVDVQRYQ